MNLDLDAKTLLVNDFKSLDGCQSINVLWSGGCDSTLVLFEILRHMKYTNNYRNVNTYSISHDQIGTLKLEFEAKYRAKFIEYCKKENLPEINHTNIQIPNNTIEIANNEKYGVCCPQPVIWITQILPLIPNNSILFAGYHKGDDFLSYEIFNNWLKIYEGMINLFGGKKIIFSMPLEYISKYQIIQELKQSNIYDLCWYCEFPIISGKNENCTCLPCQTHNQALLYYNHILENAKISQKIDDIYSKNIAIEKVDLSTLKESEKCK